MSVKGFGRHPNGKIHPVHGKKGVSEKEFSVTEKGMNDKIEVKFDPVKENNIRNERINTNHKSMKLVDRIKISFKDDGYGPYFTDDAEKGEARNKYKVTVENNGKKFTFSFGDSIANTENGETPFNSQEEFEKYKRDILELITADYFMDENNYPTYNDFAQEFGYGEDSRKGEKIYHLAMKNAEGLHRVFTEEEIAEIREELEL